MRGERCDATMLMQRDEDILPKGLPPALTEATIAERLLYRDGLILILDKPAGIAVHKGPKGGDNLEAHFGGLRFGLPRNPALAHRLDRDTSGCLVLGRHRKALELVGRLFKQGKVSKTYWAVVEGSPEADAGLVDLPLGRLDATRGWWMKVDAAGQPSQTRYRVMARGGGRALLALEPLTGRTHQLRVHCAAMGWPILGDPIYGNGGAGGPALHLHAQAISVPLAKTKAPIEVSAPIPDHMRAAIDALDATLDPTAEGDRSDPGP
jgi:tRNA pseudouridine32 synthase/23S rRNA pseudouridine746 synthase